MISGFDWLLAPGAFEAYTIVNKSISNLTLVGSYITEYRANNGGTDFVELEGDNWTVGAAYSDAFDVSIWYYNNDNYGYTQVYADAGYDFGPVAVAAQYVDTDWDSPEEDSTAYGIKASGSVAGFDLMAAYVNVDDNVVGYVDNDAIYTSMWNTLASNSVGDSYKFEAATEFYGVSASAAYAYFEYDNLQAMDPNYDEGSEFDLILGYGITDCISVDAIYTSTDYGEGEGDDQAMELIATYKF